MIDNVGWLLAKIKCKLWAGKPALNEHLRKKDITIGEHSKTATNINSSEPYLITIGNNVTISHNVDLSHTIILFVKSLVLIMIYTAESQLGIIASLELPL